jgi:hypothetical protein
MFDEESFGKIGCYIDGVALHKVGRNCTELKLYKSHCKSNELLWVLYNGIFLKGPQQLVGFAVTLVNIFKV